MIDRTVLKEHLALERRSITEIATGLSAAAVVGATLYNLGFFAPVEWSLVSLLTVQDLLVGAGVAAVPMTAAAWIAMLMGRLIRSAPKRKLIAIAAGIPVFVLAGIGFGTFFSGPLQWTLGHMACGYLMLGVVAAGANMLLKSRYLPMAWLIFSLIYIPTVLGMSDKYCRLCHWTADLRDRDRPRCGARQRRQGDVRLPAHRPGQHHHHHAHEQGAGGSTPLRPIARGRFPGRDHSFRALGRPRLLDSPCVQSHLREVAYPSTIDWRGIRK